MVDDVIRTFMIFVWRAYMTYFFSVIFCYSVFEFEVEFEVVSTCMSRIIFSLCSHIVIGLHMETYYPYLLWIVI